MKQEAIEKVEPQRLYPVTPPMVAIVIYIALAFPLRGWLVDDAAITMAYAANWSAGHGTVAQPGLAPVEGYSNPLWLALLAGLNLLGAMTVSGIKALSLLVVGVALFSLNETCKPLMSRAARTAVLILTATSSSLVTWTTSGLENPLTLLLACELLRVAFKDPTQRTAVHLGVLVALMGMNRPEGFAFLVFPLLVMWRRPRLAILCAGVATGLFACFLGLRFWTFGEFVPNTFHAKATGINPLEWLAGASDLLSGPFGFDLVFVALLFSFYFVAKREPDIAGRVAVPLAMMMVAGGLYIAMPRDWMPNLRFATAFLPATFLFTGIILSRYRMALLALVTVTVCANFVRLNGFYASPTVPLADIIGISEQSNERARDLPNSSILLPDIGGVLLTSNLRVHDLAGLTDRTIAQLIQGDRADLREYVFEDIKPTFIKTHSVWTRMAGFDEDPRFVRDYEAIAPGEYIRRNAIRSSRPRGDDQRQ